jgi:hypothetical protein
MNEGSSNDIAVPSYEFNFGLTAIIHNEWGGTVLVVVVVVIVTATTLEVELQHKKYKQCQVSRYSKQ